MFLLRGGNNKRTTRVLLMWVAVCCWFLTYSVYFRESVEVHSSSNPSISSHGYHGVAPNIIITRGGKGSRLTRNHNNRNNNGIDEVRMLQSSMAHCDGKRDCVSCLYAHVNRTSTLSEMASTSGCIWCASEKRCILSTTYSAATCDDIEFYACPAVLHTPIPQNHRVIHVGIRKGGPEALIQLHLALNHWGFRTTLDTRHSKKEKGGAVKSFFLEMYKEEFSKAPPLVWVKDYQDWHHSAKDGDVMIATETWKCMPGHDQYLLKGIRQMQWHLTVWPKRDRSECTIAGHTNFVTRDYMLQSVRALMYPYINKYIMELSQNVSAGHWKRQKRDLVLYDSDTKLTNEDLVSRTGVQRERKIASGYEPRQLYELYGQAKAGIDLQLPGGERFIYEAVLFDVCVIVDNALNGADPDDFPVPERFRVPPNDKQALNAAVDECIKRYDEVIDEFGPLKSLVLRQRVTFLRQVRRYFSNSVHVVTSLCTQEEVDDYMVRFLLATNIQIPFAVLEFLMPEDEKIQMKPAHWQRLLESSHLAAVKLTRMSAELSRELCGAQRQRVEAMPGSVGYLGDDARRTLEALVLHGWRPFTTSKRTLLTLFLPVSALLLSDEVVHYAATQLHLQKKFRANDGKPADSFFPSLSIIGYPGLVDSGTAPAFHAGDVNRLFPVAFFVYTDDLDRLVGACHKNELQQRLEATFGTHLYQKICGKTVQEGEQLDPQSTAVPVVVASEWVEQFAVVGPLDAASTSKDVEVFWGAKQLLEETVAPLLCTHLMWRELVMVGVEVPTLLKCG